MKKPDCFGSNPNAQQQAENSCHDCNFQNECFNLPISGNMYDFDLLPKTVEDAKWGKQPVAGGVEFTESKLNARLVGAECRRKFEERYGDYNLKCCENGMYASEQTRKIWNCWWVSWDLAIRPYLKQPTPADETLREFACVQVCKDLTRPYSGNPDDKTLDEIIADAKQALAQPSKPAVTPKDLEKVAEAIYTAGAKKGWYLDADVTRALAKAAIGAMEGN